MQLSKKVIITLAIVGVILLLSLPKLALFDDTPELSRGGQDGVATALPVSVHVVKPEVLRNRIQTTGTVLANEEVELQSEISGRVTGIYFEEGQAIENNQLLVKINDSELQAQLLKAEYSKRLAEDREARGRKQLQIEAISQEDYDVILNELNTVKAEMQLIEAQIEKTEIRAPFDGLVGLRYVSIGSYISPNTRIANLLDVTPVKIDFTVPEKYVNLVHVGDKINFRIQGTASEFEGEVYAIEPKIDPATRSLQLRARSANPGGAILPGAFAEIRLILDQVEEALMIPSEALIPELSGQKVYLMQGGKATPRAVEIGLRTEDRIQVTFGLAPGDTVITSGILQLRPGMPVTPLGEASQNSKPAS